MPIHESRERDLHLHLALAFDEAFAPHAGVAVASVLRQHPGDRLSFLIVHAGLTDDTERRFRDLIRQSPRASIEFLRADDQVRAYPTFSRFSRAVYMRYLIPSFVAADVGRVLYIDADVLAMRNLAALWETDLHGKIAGAVVDAFSRNHAMRLGVGAARPFFNNGLILIDVAAWRRAAATERILERIAGSGQDLSMPDQDAFNLVLGNEVHPLPLTWNVQRAAFYSTHRELGISRREHRSVTRRPSILHFTEFSKPWHSTDQHPFGYVYRRLRSSTPFADPRIQIERRQRPAVRLSTILKRAMLKLSPELLPLLRLIRLRVPGTEHG